MKRRRLIIITYSYRPDPSPRAFRWSSIAEHWVSEGHEVCVVCAQQGELPAEQWCQGVHVYRVREGLVGLLRRRVAGRPGQWREPSVAVSSRDASFTRQQQAGRLGACFRAGITWLYDRTWKKVWWPDYAVMWYVPAVRAALKLIRQHGYDTLITSSHPFTDHLVGLRIKREYPSLPWIVDIGDPFCFLSETPSNNHWLYGRLNVGVERQVFRNADGISVTNEATARIYSELFPAARDRIRVIPPLVRCMPETKGGERIFPEDDRIRLVFVGRLYAGIRSPQRLLATFQRLLETPLGSRLELHFFGWTAGCEGYFAPYERLLGTKIFLHGAVEHGLARQAMDEAHVLVNIGNTTSYQLPSKLVEYGRTGHPILNFAETAEDSSAVLLKTYPAALSLLPDEDQAEQSWVRLVEFLGHPPRVDGHELRSWSKAFEAESIVHDYGALIEAAEQHACPVGNRCDTGKSPGHENWMRRSA